MKVRHLTAADNVAPDGSLIDPLAVRHGLIVAGRVEALAGPVDPLTHLNADFAEHGLEKCAVVERLEIGAPACFEEDGLRLAWAADDAYRPLGNVDLGARLREWRAARTAAFPSPSQGRGGRGVRMSDGAFLAALQLGDSLFPSGGFTLSHGLETLAERRLVTDVRSLQSWLTATLRWQVATSDGAAAAAVWDAADDLARVAEIDRYLLATKLAREPREAATRTGRQILRNLAGIAGGTLERYHADVRAGRAPGLYASVLGLAGRQLGLSQREIVLLLLHLHVAGCLGAALRLLDVDDVEIQRIRLALAPTLVDAADAALATPWQRMYASALQTELMAMLHERAMMRLFAS